MIDKIDIFKIELHILNKLRQKLIFDTLNKDPELYTPMFKYHKQPLILKYSFDKYLISWINSHIKYLMMIIQGNNISDLDSSILVNNFINNIKKMLSNIISEDEILKSKFSSNLINKKIKFFEEMIKLNDKLNQDLNEFRFQIERDNFLFEIEIERLIKENEQ